MDDLRIGRIARALRLQLGWRQRDVADAAGCSQDEVSLLERGRINGMSVRRLRQLLAPLDAEVVILVRWRGGALDRLLDARHARLVETVSHSLDAGGWMVVPEVTYSVFGERGSIDLLAWHATTRTLLVIEAKSEITSVEDTLRRHDVKVRLAERLARERFGWNPAATGRMLVLPDERTARRRVEQHRTVFRASYPSGNVATRHWLRSPSGSFSGILFLPGTNADRAVRRMRRRAA